MVCSCFHGARTTCFRVLCSPYEPASGMTLEEERRRNRGQAWIEIQRASKLHSHFQNYPMFLPRAALLSPFSSCRIRNASRLRVVASPGFNGQNYMFWEPIDLPNILESQVERAAHGRDASNVTVFKGGGGGKPAICGRGLPLWFRRVVDKTTTSPFRTAGETSEETGPRKKPRRMKENKCDCAEDGVSVVEREALIGRNGSWVNNIGHPVLGCPGLERRE